MRARERPPVPPGRAGRPWPRSYVAPTAVWVVIVVVVAGAVGGLAYVAGSLGRGGSAAGSPTGNSTFSLLAAGTLSPYFPTLAGDLAAENPGVSAPSATQIYTGSLGITTGITTGIDVADVAALADFRLAPALLEPGSASYEVVFASTPEVLVYNPTIAAFDGINSTNWGSVLLRAVATPGVAPFGVWNASTDPNGYNEIFSMMLEGMLYGGGNVSAVYGHFYSGAPGAFARPNPAITRPESEAQAASLVEEGVVSAAITYRAFSVKFAGPHLAYVPFDPIVGLASNSSAALADYARLSTTILSSTGAPEKVVPAPVLFGITVPRDAPNPALGAAFLHLVLSPQGSAVLSENGAFTPIFPGWVDRPGAVPPLLAPDVVPMPSWALGLIP